MLICDRQCGLGKKLKVVWSWLIALVCLAGCASPLLRPDTRLQVEIIPERVYPGCVVQVVVHAPTGTRTVKGQLDFYASPVVALKSSDQGRTWRFKTQIPLEAAWQPGKYKVMVQGVDAAGYALSGEAWVIAP